MIIDVEPIVNLLAPVTVALALMLLLVVLVVAIMVLNAGLHLLVSLAVIAIKVVAQRLRDHAARSGGSDAVAPTP